MKTTEKPKKSYKVKGTKRIRKAIDNMVVNGGIVSKAMVDAGYSVNTANTPSKLTESKGYKEILKEYGLTEELITKALVSDIKKKPLKRVKELSLGAEILRMKIDKQESNIYNLNIFGDSMTKIAQRVLAERLQVEPQQEIKPNVILDTSKETQELI